MERKEMEAPPKTSREPHRLKHRAKEISFRKDVFTLSQNFPAGQQISEIDLTSAWRNTQQR
jgi:hypothetical protein